MNWEIEYDRHYKGGGKKIITHKMRKDFIRQQLEKLIADIPEGCGDITCDVTDCIEPLKAQLRKDYL